MKGTQKISDISNLVEIWTKINIEARPVWASELKWSGATEANI